VARVTTRRRGAVMAAVTAVSLVAVAERVTATAAATATAQRRTLRWLTRAVLTVLVRGPRRRSRGSTGADVGAGMRVHRNSQGRSDRERSEGRGGAQRRRGLPSATMHMLACMP
jgi:hypothetical protein